MAKTCNKCNEEKPLEGFSKRARAKDGLQSHCKECRSAISKAYRKANPEKVAASHRAWREANLEKSRASVKAWNEANPEKVAAYGKAWREAHPYEGLADSAKGRAKKYNALPPWYSQKHHDQIIGIYEERDRITAETGVRHEVDHILPMQGDTVSGFHVPENLQIITLTENRSKGSKHDFC